MIFNSVAEVFDSLEQTRGRLYDSVRNLSEDQARFRPGEEEWSVAEIAEHLSIFESLMLKLISGLVAKGEGAAPQVVNGASIAPVSIERLTAGFTGKGKAPEFLLPTGDISLERSIESLTQSREALMSFKERLQGRDFSLVTYAREPIGPLNPYQWLAFIDYHENKHINQINALTSSESFPARPVAAL